VIAGLRHRVKLLEPVESDDGAGGRTVTWNVRDTAWAEVVPVRGDEREWGEAKTPETLYRVTLRHRADLTREMRLGFDGRVLEIRALADPDGRRRWLVATCIEKRV
jgi:SPP1 family predicted phage head-tail adaptor